MGAIWERLFKSLSPQQVCWVCLLATFGAGLYGINTFAKDSDVTQIRVEMLQQRLIDLRIEQCKAVRLLQPAGFYAAQITEQSSKYQALTDAAPLLPACGEL